MQDLDNRSKNTTFLVNDITFPANDQTGLVYLMEEYRGITIIKAGHVFNI